MSKDDEYDFLFKLVLVGSTAVGKSNILLRYTKNTFSADSRTTIGVEFASKRILMKDKILKIQLWDTAGQERFRSISKAYYRGAVAALLVYSITDQKSFEDLADWYNQICEYTTKNQMIVMLVGNKLDLEAERKVKREKGLEFAEQRKLAFHQVSAFDGTNVQFIFNKMAEELYTLMIKASTVSDMKMSSQHLQLPASEKQQPNKSSPDKSNKKQTKNKQDNQDGGMKLQKSKLAEENPKKKSCC